jgi:hypothetical protein
MDNIRFPMQHSESDAEHPMLRDLASPLGQVQYTREFDDGSTGELVEIKGRKITKEQGANPNKTQPLPKQFIREARNEQKQQDSKRVVSKKKSSKHQSRNRGPDNEEMERPVVRSRNTSRGHLQKIGERVRQSSR